MVFGRSALSRRFACNANILAGVPINEYLVVKAGLGYSQRGTVFQTASFPPFYGSETGTVKMDYLELPILIFAGPELIRIFAGPQFSFPLKNDFDIDKNEFGLKYGLALDVSRWINVRIQLYKGFTNFTGTNEVVLKNNYVGFVAGIKIIKVNSRSSKSGDIPHRQLD